MTTTPASSLKERIAALQQRSTSPQSSPPRKVATRVPAPKNSLRDKIARFEEKGGASKSSGIIGIGKPPSKTGEQWDDRIKSLGNISLESRSTDQVTYVHPSRYGRSTSDTHGVSRDFASSPTSSHEEIFSETFEEDSQGLSSVLHSPSSSHFREMEVVTPPKSQNGNPPGNPLVSTTTPLIVINNNNDPLIDDLPVSALKAQSVEKSVLSNMDSTETRTDTTNSHETSEEKEDQLVGDPKSDYASKANHQIMGKGRRSSDAESPTIDGSLSESFVSSSTSVDDSANQVLPILDAFPTVPGHLPPSSSSQSMPSLSRQSVNSPTPGRKSTNSIHSNPSSTPSACSTVTTLSNNPKILSTALPQASQNSKSQTRPKSSVPFWYDDDSEDGEPGWVSVTVTTRRY